MKIPDDHSTSIDNLLYGEDNCIFLSDWNKYSEALEIKNEIITNAFNKAKNNTDKYFFIDETNKLKKWFYETILGDGNVNENSFAISTNGTATVFLIIYILGMYAKLNVVLLTPIYFTYIKLLKDLSANVEFLQVIQEGKLHIDFDELDEMIKRNHSNLIIVNDPIFGSGNAFGYKNYNMLISICKKYKVRLLIDYIYGGMEWGHTTEIINRDIINEVANNSEVIFVESISKRMFLNGAKNSLLFAQPEIIRDFEKVSVHTIGCMTCAQISLFEQLYDPSNHSIVINVIDNNIITARTNFELLYTLLINTDLRLSYCDSGYFCLIYVPYTCFGNYDSTLIAKSLIDNANILTIPHDRYLHFNSDYYCFRINLTIPSKVLLSAIERLLRFTGF